MTSTAYRYRNPSLNGMGLFWDDNLEVPTIYLDSAEPEIYDARDYWATGESSMSIDSSILDARDAWAEYGGAPVVSTGIDSSWSFSDILKTGTAIAQEYVKYQAMTLPNGSRIYGRIDPYTGQYVTGGRTVTLPSSGISQFINQNLPLIALGGLGLLVLATSGSQK